ncbi:hypothetical protein D3C85_1534620 [compost metagenome]
MLTQGLTLHQRLASQGRAINLAFNLHPAQLACSVLTERIPALLKRFQVPATQIMFEITESGLISAPASSLENKARSRLRTQTADSTQKCRDHQLRGGPGPGAGLLTGH